MGRTIACAICVVATCLSLWLKTVAPNVGPVFWLPLLLLVALTSLVILSKEEGYVPLALLAATVQLVGIFLYPYWFQLPGYDAYFEAGYAQLVLDNGSWNPALGFGYAKISGYGYYPAVHLILTAWGAVTSAPILSLVKYAAPLVVNVTVLGAALMMSKAIFPREKTTFVGLMYITSLGFMAIFPSRRAIALILGVLAIGILFRKPSGFHNERARSIAATILIATLALADHFIGATILASTILVAVLLRLRKSDRPTFFVLPFLVGTVTFAAWWVFAAYSLFVQDLGHMEVFWKSLLTFGAFEAGPSSLYGYGALERALTMVSWAIFALLGFIGVLFWLRTRRGSLSIVWGTLGLLMSGFATTMALHPWYHVLSITLLWFATLLLSGPASSLLLKLNDLFPRGVRVLALVLLALMFSGSLISVYGARTLDQSPNESCMIGEIRGFSHEQVVLGDWLGVHLSTNASILGDEGGFVLLSSLHGIEIVEDFSWPGDPSLFAAIHHGSQPTYVIWGNSYVTCKSTHYESLSPVVTEHLGNFNRLWDAGEWQFLY